MSPESTPTQQDVCSTISEEMVRIHDDSYGPGNATATTYVLDDYVLSVLDVDLMPSEKLLVSAGREDLVHLARREFQRAIDSTYIAAIERATGRTVEAFVSDIHVEPAFAFELFKLEAHTTAAIG